MTDSKKRIYLRLIDIEPLQKSEEEALAYVKNTIDEIMEIEWLSEPSLHIKGGYIVIGNISNEFDVDSLSAKLSNAGFLLGI